MAAMARANEAGPAPQRGAEARNLVRRFHDGALATQSATSPGYPYVSALPFCTDQAGRIVLLISHLAEHTRNAVRDAHAAFMVASAGPQVQEQPRLCQIGDLEALEDEMVAARYLRLFPEAGRYLQIGGFRFFRLQPGSLRYIAGFGSIHTVAPEDYLAPELPIGAEEAGILAHMNRDHAHNLRDYCRHVHGIEPQACTMVGIDCDGFDVRADAQLLRFDFEGRVGDAAGARKALVALAQASRR